MTPQPKQDARERVKHILDVSMALAEQHGYNRVSRDQVARVCGFPSSSLITYHMGSMVEFRRKIMREAIKRANLRVLAQGLAAQDRQALKAPEDMKARALQSLAA